MKRNMTAVILSLCLLFTSCAGAEGLLPSLTDTIGKPMPSLGEALNRYPDEESATGEGKSIEVFQNVTETDFNTFSIYLSDKNAALADYRTTGSTFSAAIQVEGKTISFSYDTQSLEASVTYPKGTYDEWLDYAKTQFESAVHLIDAGQTDDGIQALILIPVWSEYKPVAEYLEAHPQIAAAVAEAIPEALDVKYSVGKYVTFGHYPQTYNGNDSTPIEWLVVDRNGNKALLLSHYGLDAQPYNTENTEVTWENCSLRTWLNSTFLDIAFTAQEQAGILLTEVDNSKSQCYSGWSGSGGNNTQDKVFLLSCAEANHYLGVTKENEDNMKSRVAPTAYADMRGAYIYSNVKTEDGTDTGWWWLRSPGDYQICAADVSADGCLEEHNITYETGCVRPALWINLKSDIF